MALYLCDWLDATSERGYGTNKTFCRDSQCEATSLANLNAKQHCLRPISNNHIYSKTTQLPGTLYKHVFSSTPPTALSTMRPANSHQRPTVLPSALTGPKTLPTESSSHSPIAEHWPYALMRSQWIIKPPFWIMHILFSLRGYPNRALVGETRERYWRGTIQTCGGSFI